MTHARQAALIVALVACIVPSRVDAGTSTVASWYCAPGRSACTAGYPSGLYAAAGPSVRRLLGPGWMGRYVRVVARGRAVIVRLIDVCACPSGRGLDLYSGAFARLAPLSAGLLDARVERL